MVNVSPTEHYLCEAVVWDPWVTWGWLLGPKPCCPDCGSLDVKRDGLCSAGPRRVIDVDRCFWVLARAFRCQACKRNAAAERKAAEEAEKAGTAETGKKRGRDEEGAGAAPDPPAPQAPKAAEEPPARRGRSAGSFLAYDVTVMQQVCTRSPRRRVLRSSSHTAYCNRACLPVSVGW